MNERKKQILDYLSHRQSARIDEIARAVHYSRSTVRRDLIELEHMYAVSRSRGEASIIVSTSKERHYRLRETENVAAKTAIAHLCLPLIPDNSSMFLDSGTTTAFLCREIPFDSRITVITSGLETARLLLDRRLEDLMVAGGYTRRGDPSLVGEQTVEFIRQFSVDLCILSAYGLDADGVYEASVQQSYVKKAMIDRARVRILMCDSSKFDKRYKFRLSDLDVFDYIITEKRPPDALTQACRKARFLYPESPLPQAR